MADKSSFTPEEWKKVLSSVMLTGMAVTMSDRSGLWGMMKESFASTSSMLGTDSDPNANPLIKAVVADFKTSEGRTAARDQIKSVLSGVSAPADAQAKAIAALQDVSSILTAKARDDAGAFTAFLNSVGEKTANASNEGGFLGFGGVAVSDAEKAALAEIASALGPRTA